MNCIQSFIIRNNPLKRKLIRSNHSLNPKKLSIESESVKWAFFSNGAQFSKANSQKFELRKRDYISDIIIVSISQTRYTHSNRRLLWSSGSFDKYEKSPWLTSWVGVLRNVPENNPRVKKSGSNSYIRKLFPVWFYLENHLWL